MRTSKLTLIEHSRILCKAVPLHDKQVQKRGTGISPFALEPGASRRQMVVPRPGRFTLEKKIHWVDLRAALDGSEKLHVSYFNNVTATVFTNL